MAKYRKKPVEVEAVQWTGGNPHEILNLAGDSARHFSVDFVDGTTWLEVGTQEGVVRAYCGDWIIKGVNGEFYPCKPDIFEKTYERVEEDV